MKVKGFSSEDKAIIKNAFVEKGWSLYRICQEHPSRNWNRVSVHKLLKWFEQAGSWIEGQELAGQLQSLQKKMKNL